MKRFNLLAIIALLALALVAMGCKSDEDDSEVVAGYPSAQGTWTSGCHLENEFSGDYKNELFTITASDFDMTEQMSGPDSACTVVGWEQTTSFTYATGGLGSIPSIPLAFQELNLTVANVTITPRTAAEVSAMMASAKCGINTWALDVATDVTGLANCDSFDPSKLQLAAGSMMYMAWIVDAVGPKLYLSDGERCGEVAGNRCTTFNAEQFMTPAN